jgi:type VI protein secretion system component VasK
MGCGGIHEAPARLNALSSTDSPLLALFYTVSHNTAVADPQIKQIFQSTQALVDPNAADKPIGAGNQAYMTALLNLSSAVSTVAPTVGPDPAPYAPITTAASLAEVAARQTAQTFTIDAQMHTENTVLNLLLAPVQCAAHLAPSPGAGANIAGAKLCGAVSPLLGKFPFSPGSTSQASLDEVNQVFAPDTGAIWTTVNGPLKPYLVQAGSQWVQASNPPQTVNPKFLQYFSRLAHISSDLYPAGAKSPAFGFGLRFLPSKGIENATLVVDGQRIPTGGSSNQFTWNGASAHNAYVVYDSNEGLQNQGTWALFQLVRNPKAVIAHTGSTIRLSFPLQTSTTFAGQTIDQSNGKVVSFEISGPGAELLPPDVFSGLTCVSTVVKAQ